MVPVVAKAIEIMMEPKALRQRAELIENTDLSAEALLQGMSTKDFSNKISTLFRYIRHRILVTTHILADNAIRSYDVNGDGVFDQEEFITCLQALELHLSRVEMLALFDAADSKHSVR